MFCDHIRRFPTLIVFFSMATTVVAAPITWIGGNANWDATITNWNPNDEPDSDDEAIFNTPNSVNLANASESIMALTMSGGIDLLLNGNDMTVNGGNVTLSGASTLLDVPTNSLLNTDDVFVNADASLRLRGGTLTMAQAVGEGVLTVAVGGALGGFGTINSSDVIAAANTTVVSLGGNLVVTSFDLFSQQAATLAINVPANGRVDLDQTGAVVDITRNDTLEINGAAHDPAVDAYSGTMNLSEGATLDMSNAWGMNAGSINANTNGINAGTAGAAATIAGAAFTQTGGTINLADNLDSLRFSAAYTAIGGTINNNGLVIFNNAATINGADFQMNGANASLSVADGVGVGNAVTITQGNFDLGGTGADTNVTTIGDGAFLNLQIDFDSGSVDVLDHTIDLNDGELRVFNVDDGIAGSDTIWHLSGGVLNANLGITNYLSGSELIIQAETINVDPGAELSIVTTGVEITSPTINVSGRFDISTVSRWTNSNVSVTGTGVLAPGIPTIGNGAIAADVVWNVTTVDWDDDAVGLVGDFGTSIEAGSSLTINADTIEADSNDGYDATINIDSSDLTVNTPAPWRMEHVLNIDNQSAIPTINGSRMIVGDANGATVNVGGNGGAGVHDMNAPLTLETNGVVNISAGATFQVDGDTIFEGGQVTGGGNFAPAGTNTVNGFTRIDVAQFNFDRGSWTINPNGTLSVDVGDYDSDSATKSFNSTITINEHGTLGTRTDDPAFVVDGGAINMIGTVGGVITGWQGGPVEIGNDAGTLDTDLVVSGDLSYISTTVLTFFSDANVTINAGSNVSIGGPFTNFNSVNGTNNASFTGGGELQFNTVLNFNEVTTLNVSTVYLKGGGVFGRTVTINADTTINADQMGSFGDVNNDGNDDILVLNDFADLTVNLTDPDDEWQINSPAVVNINAAAAPFLGSGIKGSDVNILGTVNVSGSSYWTARVDLAGTINTTLASDIIQFGGGSLANPNRLLGGTITGLGQLALDFGHSLVGHGTINSDIQFLDVSTRVAADDGTLTINGAFTGFGGSTGTQDADGILNVVNPWNTSSFITVTMAGGEIRGGTITNFAVGPNGGIHGFGLVSSQVINTTRIQAEGGTLIVQTPLNDNDWDGGLNFGQLWAVSGNLELRDDATFLYNGWVRALGGQEVFANGFELEFEPSSTLSLEGGTYRSTHSTDIGGMVNVEAGMSTMRIAGTTVFENGSSTTLVGDLQLDNAATWIDSGATFSGGGTLINIAGRTLTLADGADVDVLLQNDGTLVLGASVGQTQGLDFQQTASGVWELELGGTGLDEFDHMNLTGAATLDGALELSLLVPYEPSLGDMLQILSAAGGLNGTTFADVIQPPTMPANLMFDVIYNPTNVELVVVSDLPGDYNRNGVVDAADYTVWRDHLDQMFTLAGENPAAATPGLVDQEDYDFWKASFGLTVGSGTGATTAEQAVPEPTSMALVLLAALGLVARERLGVPYVTALHDLPGRHPTRGVVPVAEDRKQ